jgi:hypothetical protein
LKVLKAFGEILDLTSFPEFLFYFPSSSAVGLNLQNRLQFLLEDNSKIEN